MFIIWGTRHVQSQVGQRIFYCPACQSQVPCDMKESRPFFTLYFVPVFPTGGVERFVSCRICGGLYPPESLRAPLPAQKVRHAGAGDTEPLDVLPVDAGDGPDSSAGWPTSQRLRGLPIGFWLLLAFVGLPVLAFMALLAFVLIHGSATDRQPSSVQNSKMITSKNGLVRLTVPRDWQSSDLSDDPEDIKVVDGSRNACLYLVTQPKSALAADATVDNLAQSCSERVVNGGDESIISNGRISSGPTTLTINSRPAAQYELRGKKSGKSLILLITVIEGNDSFYTVMAWTSLTRAAKNKSVLQSVIQSVKEVKPAPPADSDSPARSG